MNSLVLKDWILTDLNSLFWQNYGHANIDDVIDKFNHEKISLGVIRQSNDEAIAENDININNVTHHIKNIYRDNNFIKGEIHFFKHREYFKTKQLRYLPIIRAIGTNHEVHQIIGWDLIVKDLHEFRNNDISSVRNFFNYTKLNCHVLS